METNKAIPKGRLALFLMQVFSMFAFAVMQSTMILYLTGGLHLKDHFSTALTAGFIALNFSLHLLGGFVGGRFLSYRGLFILGMLLQAAGAIIIAIPHFSSLILGLSVFLAGCGLDVVCINCMLTQFFHPNDKRREAAFLWNYSGKNIGFFLGFTISGFFQLYKAFHWLFLIAGLGSLIAVLLAVYHWKLLRDQNTIFSLSVDKKRRAFFAFKIMIVLIFILMLLLYHARFLNALILSIGGFVALLFTFLAGKEKDPKKGKKIWAYLILTISSLIFWTLYQMAPIGLTLFFDRNVNKIFFGVLIPPQWMQNINTVVVILGAPFMAWVNGLLRKKGYKISIPFQFTTALFLIGIGFLLLPIGIYYASVDGYSSIWWTLLCFFFISIGELFIAPIGYAMIGQLLPVQLQSLAMGAWLMVRGVAVTLSSYFSQFALGKEGIRDPIHTNQTYSLAFLELGLFAILGAVILLLIRRFLHRLIQEQKEFKSDEETNYQLPQE